MRRPPPEVWIPAGFITACLGFLWWLSRARVDGAAVLLLFGMVAFNPTYCDGYRQGFNSAYCQGHGVECLGRVPALICSGAGTYQEGYDKGWDAGAAAHRRSGCHR